MNKVIKGRRYDTEKAEKLGDAYYDQSDNLNWWGENLYRKRTGEFFLYCHGGANSKYANYDGNNSYSGEKIIPLTQEKAEEWAEENLSGEECEQIFGVVEDEKTRITIYVSPSLANKIKQLAIERKISMSEMVERMVERF